MKKLLLTALIWIIVAESFSLFAQRYDNNWLFGYETDTVNIPPKWGNVTVNFGQDSADVTYIGGSYCNMCGQNMSMCDRQGNPIFYSNGYVLFNAQLDTMLNGKKLNPFDFQASTNSWPELGYCSPQCLITLPDPGDSMRYYVLQGDVRLFIIGEMRYACIRRVLVHTVDMRGDGSKGEVVQKNKALMLDSLWASFTAVRHANGRDWWVVLHRQVSSHVFMYRLSPSGFTLEHELDLPVLSPVTRPDSYDAYGIFSPDGSMYCLHTYYKLRIWDFDRCSGTFSNPREWITGVPGTQNGILGMAISPNSRYLYAGHPGYMIQYDLRANNIEASGDTVAHVGQDSFAASFFLWQLAPDGRIYGSATNAATILHVIQHPDSAGRACKLEPPGVELGVYNAFGMPHFPNYRLGPLAGSVCDTIPKVGVDPGPSTGARVWVYPNPASDRVTLSGLPPGQHQLMLMDLMGRRVLAQEIAGTAGSIEVSSLPEGSYTWWVMAADGRVWQGILIVQKY